MVRIGKVDKLKIINTGDKFVIINLKGEYKHHTHIRGYKTCEMLIKLIYRKQAPRSPYLRQSAKRLTLDQSYIIDIDNKIAKDRQKQGYYNLGGGDRK